MSFRFKPQIIKTVASMYISAAGNQGSGNSAGQNDNCKCIMYDKMYCGHAQTEQVPQVVDGSGHVDKAQTSNNQDSGFYVYICSW